jgi:uncharacterized membrane protein YkoI
MNGERLRLVNSFMNIEKTVRSSVVLAIIAAFTASTAIATDESQASLKKQAKITEAEATKTALSKVGPGTVKSSELEKENGKLIWSFDIAKPKTRNITEVQVDAKTGKIVSIQIETPANQAKEAQSNN